MPGSNAAREDQRFTNTRDWVKGIKNVSCANISQESMNYNFTIPGKLAGLNELVGSINRNRYAGNVLKRDQTNLCAQWVVYSKVPFFSHPVEISFVWVEPDARRDLDNISCGQKWILDALVETGRLKNDTRQWVRSLSHEFPVPNKFNPRVEVFLKEIVDKRGE